MIELGKYQSAVYRSTLYHCTERDTPARGRWRFEVLPITPSLYCRCSYLLRRSVREAGRLVKLWTSSSGVIVTFDIV